MKNLWLQSVIRVAVGGCLFYLFYTSGKTFIPAEQSFVNSPIVRFIFTAISKVYCFYFVFALAQKEKKSSMSVYIIDFTSV